MAFSIECSVHTYIYIYILNVVFMAEVYCLCHVIYCNIQVIIIGVIYANLFVVILVVGLRIYSLILL